MFNRLKLKTAAAAVNKQKQHLLRLIDQVQKRVQFTCWSHVAQGFASRARKLLEFTGKRDLACD